MQCYTIDQLSVGQEASFSKTITEEDVALYAKVSGDFNPLHLDAAYARQTPFQERIVHGMLPAGLLSALLGTHLPGCGTVYLEQSLRFTAATHLNDTVTAKVKVTEIDKERNRVKLETTCSTQNGTLVLKGYALVKAPTGTPR